MEVAGTAERFAIEAFLLGMVVGGALVAVIAFLLTRRQ
jgi:hypothetical protein